MFKGGNDLEGGIKKAFTITLKKPFSEKIESMKSFKNQEEKPIDEKKAKFELFLTSRKRFSRLAIMQGIYFYEQFKQFNETEFSIQEEVNEVYRIIIYFYKRMFFYQRYGNNKKNKKLEEKFIRSAISNYIINQNEINDLISKNLSKKWRISRLNSVVRAGLRAAIVEFLFQKKISHKIIISEYTNLTALSVFEEKQIAFFNGILQKIINQNENERS